MTTTDVAADLDLVCWSARDLLRLTSALRGTHPRDGLRALEDVLLDQCNRLEPA